MFYNYRYRLEPSDDQRETLDYHRDVCRQLYNHALYRFDQISEDEGTVKQRVRKIRDELPDLKDWWEELTDVYAKVLQPTVMRIAHNVTALGTLKEKGYNVGELKWKPPREFRSFTYNQSGHQKPPASGWQPEICDFWRRLRTRQEGWSDCVVTVETGRYSTTNASSDPNEATIKEVTLKKEPTGEWFAIFGIEFDREPPEKPDEITETVGIDVGVLTYAHDTEGTAVGSLDLTDERERLEREQRKFSRKQHGSNNWEKQRQTVAECHQRIKRKRCDFLHKLSTHYATEYDLVAVEALNAKGLMELPSNSRNRAAAAWGTFRRMLEYKCKREGTYFVAVDPAGTTKECAACGVATDKPLWVREHACPSCGFTADRDWNAVARLHLAGSQNLRFWRRHGISFLAGSNW